MADEDDRLPRCLQFADDTEKLVGLARGENGGGLVEDDDARLAVQGLDDLNPLLDPHGQVLHEGVRVDGEPVAARELEHVLAGPPAVEQSEHSRTLHTQHDVLGDGEDGHQHEVLVDHAYPGVQGVARVVERDDFAVDEDLALVGPQEPVEDVHQRRLAGSVLAEQGVDLARLNGEVDAVVGDEAAKTFRDPTQLELQRDLPTDMPRSRAVPHGTALERTSVSLP